MRTIINGFLLCFLAAVVTGCSMHVVHFNAAELLQDAVEAYKKEHPKNTDISIIFDAQDDSQ